MVVRNSPRQRIRHQVHPGKRQKRNKEKGKDRRDKNSSPRYSYWWKVAKQVSPDCLEQDHVHTNKKAMRLSPRPNKPWWYTARREWGQSDGVGRLHAPGILDPAYTFPSSTHRVPKGIKTLWESAQCHRIRKSFLPRNVWGS